jgi:molybdopterin-dependent oxidoreductase alpha subunit
MPTKLPRTAGGWSAILNSLKMSERAGGLLPMMKALFSKNSCKSCALGMGGQKGGMRDEKGHFPAVCNKSFLAQASDMQGPLPVDFFQKHDIETLSRWSPRQLELSGRLTQPVICDPGNTHYQYISWEEATSRVTEQLKITSPGRIFFYASGRSSNEAGFLLQLFARMFGTNHVNNCSYYCHQASGVGLTESLGISTATVQLEDLDKADMIFLIGANPPSNHPRFMRNLMDLRRRGGEVIVINPAIESGLVNFSVPSDIRSLLFGTEIASSYIQPHIGGDIALFKGIGKALLELAIDCPNFLDESFIEKYTDGFEKYKMDLQASSWDELELASGIAVPDIKKFAGKYANARNVVFAWAMGITHHAHGVANVQSIVNLALLRGMIGRKNAGLLPLRGHSNVQGIGSVGVTPKLKQTIFDRLESQYHIQLPKSPGMDTMACMEAASNDQIDFAWNLGGNLYGSNPDARFAWEALSKIGFSLYMNTTLNQGHFLGRGKTTLILPVLARDEEPHKTTQESMFSFIRLSDGGRSRYSGPRSEIQVIAELGKNIFPDNPIRWSDLEKTGNIRQMIGAVVPGFDKIKTIDQTLEEFHIEGRSLHSPQFPTANGKAKFGTFPLPNVPGRNSTSSTFTLMTIRSEGQFNTVVYDNEDRYRGIKSRNVILMSAEDMTKLELKENDRVKVNNSTGELISQKVLSYPIKPGNVMMYYPEANVLVPKSIDPDSKTPSFKSIEITVTKEN